VTARLDFSVAGVQKSGTTTLDAWLRLHPSIGMAGVKETHFFDDESRDWRRPVYADLEANYVDDGLLHGEATPITLYWWPAQYRMREYNPALKLILVFRDPIDRAYSQWRMRWRVTHGPDHFAGPPERLSFEDAVRMGPSRVLGQQEMPGLNRYASYVERGLYGLQLKHLLSVFPRECLLLLNFDELVASPGVLLARVAEFLGVASDGFPQSVEVHEHSGGGGGQAPPLSRDVIAVLQNRFREDVQLFTELSGLDVRCWRTIVGH
jgi:hypothetical protein